MKCCSCDETGRCTQEQDGGTRGQETSADGWQKCSPDNHSKARSAFIQYGIVKLFRYCPASRQMMVSAALCAAGRCEASRIVCRKRSWRMMARICCSLAGSRPAVISSRSRTGAFFKSARARPSRLRRQSLVVVRHHQAGSPDRPSSVQHQAAARHAPGFPGDSHLLYRVGWCKAQGEVFPQACFEDIGSCGT